MTQTNNEKVKPKRKQMTASEVDAVVKRVLEEMEWVPTKERAQTGWVCTWCGPSGCVYMYPRCDRPTGCPSARYNDKFAPRYRPDWQPFYGKVVDE